MVSSRENKSDLYMRNPRLALVWDTEGGPSGCQDTHQEASTVGQQGPDARSLDLGAGRGVERSRHFWGLLRSGADRLVSAYSFFRTLPGLPHPSPPPLGSSRLGHLACF